MDWEPCSVELGHVVDLGSLCHGVLCRGLGSYVVEKGYVVAPSDFGLYRHIPHRLYNQGAMDTRVIEQFSAPGNVGLNNLLSGNQAGVSFYNYLVQVFSDPGDRILDPFCGNGASGVAAIVNGRSFVGVEYNQDRARSAELALELLPHDWYPP